MELNKAVMDDCATAEEVAECGRLVPQGDRIVVLLDDAKGGIQRRGKLWVATEEKKPMFGTVVEVGEGRVTESGAVVPVSPDIKPGRRICFGRYSGVEVEVNGDTVHIIRETDVLAVLERE